MESKEGMLWRLPMPFLALVHHWKSQALQNLGKKLEAEVGSVPLRARNRNRNNSGDAHEILNLKKMNTKVCDGVFQVFSPTLVLSSSHHSQKWGSFPARDTLSGKGHHPSLPNSFYTSARLPKDLSRKEPLPPSWQGSVFGQKIEAGMMRITWPRCLGSSILTK